MNFKQTRQDVDTVCFMLKKHVKLIQYRCFPDRLKPHYKYGLLTFCNKVLICYMYSLFNKIQAA